MRTGSQEERSHWGPDRAASPAEVSYACCIEKSRTMNAKQKGETMKSKERAVLVTAAHRGVFFGYATDTSSDVIKLRAGRLCVYWTSDLRGFMGLASHGPSSDCKIGPAADIEVRAITSVVEVSKEAVEQWEKAPWR